MIVQCRFCAFTRETATSLPILRVAAEELEKGSEDWALWLERYVHTVGTKAYNGVKVHMGRMHKQDAYVGIWPNSRWHPEEEAIIKKYSYEKSPA